MPGRPPLRIVSAVGLVAGCTLALQVLLTRIFAAELFYHFAFFAISLALLGTGAAGIAIYVRPKWFSAPVESLLARWCMVFAALLLIVPAVLVRLDYTYANFNVTASFAANLGVAAVAAALPFLAAGVVIALAIRAYVAHVGRVYAFDLAGAALGAVAIVPVLWLVPAPLLAVALGLLAACAALLCAPAGSRDRALAAGATGIAALALLAGAATSLYKMPTHFPIPSVADRWTPISRVVGYSGKGPRGNALVSYDQDVAPVPFHGAGGPLPNWRRMGLGPQSIAFRTAPLGRGLIIGGGGGRDIYNALSSGERGVDVIELNRAIRDVVDGPLARWSGKPYELPGVRTSIGDGRSTLAARDTRYNVINIGFTNTLTAGSGSAYALSENNLYTVEAFQEYFDHLSPGGILSISRLYRFAGDEVLRATIVALTALKKDGVARPRDHVVVMLATDSLGEVFGTVLTRPSKPFTRAEVARLGRLARARDAELVFAPGGPYRREWRGLAAATSLTRFCNAYPLNVCATTDNKPFFLNSTRLSDLGAKLPPGTSFIARTPYVVLLIVLGILIVLAVLGFVLPLALQRTQARPPLRSLVFFAAIGLGFLMLEVVLIQRLVLFLGFPTYALSVVLFALLLATGLGAALSSRWRDPRSALTASLAGACVLIALAALGLEPLLRELIDLPFAARVAITVGLLVPVGVLLGAAMPLGLGRLSGLHPTGVVWAWGINGVTSVLAAVLAVFIAIEWGFQVTTLAALACYLVALGHAALGRWPAPGASAGSEEPGAGDPAAAVAAGAASR